ncbi:MAG: hypothetical protein QHI48_01865 [Bacteroidota bacterium]|nr:hypothetical protein [Bacteroidota bacterium]
MSKHYHPWLRPLNVPAVCPKCGAPELRRSHAKTRLEKFRRDHSTKRLFRCHACGWRGWLNEHTITYTARGITEFSVPETGDIPVPDVKLDELGTGTLIGDAHAGETSGRWPETGERGEELPPSFRAPPVKSDSDAGGGTVSEEPLPIERQPAPEETARLFRHVGKPCPACGAQKLHRSRHRTVFERLRKALSGKRPYRCHACGWRGWLPKEY